MNNTRYFLIQMHAVMSLIGYWCMHSLITLAVGQSTRTASIIYDGVQLCFSLYVICICRKSIIVESGRSFLSFYSMLLVLYSLRMFYDMAAGPFVGQIPSAWFWNDILMTVISKFVAIWAIITSRKWINVEKIVKLVFWLGLITILAIVVNLRAQGLSASYEDERLEGGQGLGSLTLVKLGAFVLLAAIHLLINQKDNIVLKVIHVCGIILGGWMLLASGARGGVVGLVIALGIYLLVSARRNYLLLIISITAVVLVIINIVPILTWVSEYFPIFGQRMLNTILENDQSYRQEIRFKAISVTLDHPFFGYSYRLYPTPTGFRAHNGILEVLIALGIPIGLLFVYFVYIKGLIMSIKKMTDRQFFFPALMMVFVIVSSMSSSSISDNCFGFAVCLFGAAYYYQQGSNKQYVADNIS